MHVYETLKRKQNLLFRKYSYMANILSCAEASSGKGRRGFGVCRQDFIICYSEGYKRGNVYKSQRGIEKEGERERESKNPRELFQGLVVGESVYRGECHPCKLYLSQTPLNTHTYVYTRIHVFLRTVSWTDHWMRDAGKTLVSRFVSGSSSASSKSVWANVCLHLVARSRLTVSRAA